MKTEAFRRNLKRVMAASCIAILQLFVMSAYAENQQASLQGPAFSDPARTLEMSADWLKQPIQYEDWAKGADVAVSLDQHFYQFFKPVIEKYAGEHKLKIKVREGTCGISSGLLSRKAIDIGGFCCPPAASDRMPGLRFHTLGITGLTILAHPDNPVDNITLDQARKIFQGRITHWSGLKTAAGRPGSDMTIQVFARLHCKLRPGHWCILLSNEDLFSTGLYELGSIPDVIEAASVNPKAIAGFESIYMAYYRHPQKTRPKFLTIDGYSPANSQDIISGGYPIYFVFNITTWEGKSVENPHAQRLVDFLMQQISRIDSRYNVIPASELRKAGWKFKGDELVGGPR